MALLLTAILLALAVSNGRGINEVCMTKYQCSGGQTCVNAMCQCSDAQVINNGRCISNNGLCQAGLQVYFNGQCYKTVPIDGQCVTSYQCLAGSSCYNDKCVCPTGTNNTNGKCVDSNGKCGPNQILIQEKCYTFTQIGQHCQISAQCIGGSLCDNGWCTCPEGTSPYGQVCRDTVTPAACPNGEVSVNGICVPRVPPGQKCNDSIQCLDGSSCTAGYCICPEGLNNIKGYCRKLTFTDRCDESTTIELNGVCVEVRKPGGFCQRSEQCLGGSVCVNGYCSCPSETTLFTGYCINNANCSASQVEVNDRCYDQSKIGDYCLVSEQCLGGSECTYAALCQCPYGTEEVNGGCRHSNATVVCPDEKVLANETCADRVVPGKKCNFTEQCLGGSECLDEICVCPEETKLHEDLEKYCAPVINSTTCNDTQIEIGGECTEYVPPGYNCTDNRQCLAFSTCPAGVCECSYGYTEVFGYCVKIQIEPSTACRMTEVRINGHCYTRSYIGQYCIYEEQCQGGSSCTDNYCTCASGGTIQGSRCSNEADQCKINQIKVDGKCYDTIEIGEGCELVQQCRGGSECVRGVCTCPEETRRANNTCIHINDICASNQVDIQGQCYDKKAIGEFCVHTEQCMGGSRCDQSKCTCPKGTINAGGRCKPNVECKPYEVFENGLCLASVSIGMKCSKTSQCIASASCTPTPQIGYSTCQCNPGLVFIGSQCAVATTGTCPYSTVFIPQSNNCLSLVQNGQFCTFTSQCMGFSACIGNFCACPVGFTNVNDICRTDETSSKCASNQVEIGSLCFPKVDVNGYCVYPQQCKGGSDCVRNYCTCPLGTALSDGTCKPTGRSPMRKEAMHKQFAITSNDVRRQLN